MAVSNAIQDLFSSINELLSSIFNAFYHVLQTIFNTIIGFFTGLVNLVTDVFQGAIDVVGGLGKFVLSKSYITNTAVRRLVADSLCQQAISSSLASSRPAAMPTSGTPRKVDRSLPERRPPKQIGFTQIFDEGATQKPNVDNTEG